MFPTQDLATAPEVSSYTLFFRKFCTIPLGQFKIIDSRMSLHQMLTPLYSEGGIQPNRILYKGVCLTQTPIPRIAGG